MSKYQHTLYYESREDLVTQLDTLLTKLLRGGDVQSDAGTEVKCEPYAKVRQRYLHLGSVAFCTRVKRFIGKGGSFPNEKGESGQRITRLYVTKALHAYLSEPLARGKKNKAFQAKKSAQ